nr:MAG TPA: hypothetical protein [Caudoviricetes sp.]
MTVNYITKTQCVTANKTEANFVITKYKLIREKLSHNSLVLYFLSLESDEVFNFLTGDLDIDLNDYKHSQELKLLGQVVRYVRKTAYDVLKKTFPRTFNTSKSFKNNMDILQEHYMVNKALDNSYSKNMIEVASNVLDSLLFNNDYHTLTYGYFTTPEESKNKSITLTLEVIEVPSNINNRKAKFKDSIVNYVNNIQDFIEERNMHFLMDLCDHNKSSKKYERDILKAIISYVEEKRAHGEVKDIDIDLGISKPVFLLEFISLTYKYRNVTIEAYERFSSIADTVFDILQNIKLDINTHEDKITVTIDKTQLCYDPNTGRKTTKGAI